MDGKPEYITVGRLGRPRGVSGELYITPATDDPKRFVDLTKLVLVGNGQRREFEIIKVVLIGGKPVVSLRGITSREAAARLTNLLIEIPFDQIRPLEDGRYYQFDLVGCKVTAVDGTELGTLAEVMTYPASDLFRIKSKRFGELLLPAIEQFIERIDIEKKEIIVNPPNGLLDALADKKK